MKLLIASDLHGSAYYTQLLKERFIDARADQLILLGDLLYHGPRNDLPLAYEPKKVIEILNSMKESILCIRGNCDSEVDQMVLDFPIMAEWGLLYLAERKIYLTHGHKDNPVLGKGDILLYGHTHIPALKCLEDGSACFNPGSVSLPKEGTKNSYMLYEDGVFSIRGILDGNVLDSIEI